MTMVLLVRHANHALLGRVLVGREGGVTLDETGRKQARHLARRLANERIAFVRSSPRERARETAEPIAQSLGVGLDIAEEIDELDAGAWSGQTFDELARDADWHAWNEKRGSPRPPQGESMSELQERVITYLDRVYGEAPDDAVVVVSHAEVIRAALMHYLHLPLDDFASVEIAPASISRVAITCGHGEVLAVNERISL